MNKYQLRDEISERTNLTKTAVNKALDAAWDIIQDQIAAGEKVMIRNFGSFVAVTHKARDGRNPQTGESMRLPSKRVAKFKPGKGLKKALN